MKVNRKLACLRSFFLWPEWCIVCLLCVSCVLSLCHFTRNILFCCLVLFRALVFMRICRWEILKAKGVEGGRGRGSRGWVDSITDSMDRSLSKLQKIMKDREVWHAAVLGIAKSWTRLTTEQKHIAVRQTLGTLTNWDLLLFNSWQNILS